MRWFTLLGWLMCTATTVLLAGFLLADDVPADTRWAFAAGILFTASLVATLVGAVVGVERYLERQT